uniref:Macrophage-expressed gene 1 protein n=1 Tax=Panagrolaimus superbus TaxID=310955 RepID=A0A914XWP7_9BILA
MNNFCLNLFILFLFSNLSSSFGTASEEHLSNVNFCLKSAKTIPNNLLNGRTLAGIVGYGWDDLQSVITKPVFVEEFKKCQAEPTGAFLLPDNIFATPILETSLDRMAEYFQSFNDFKETITNSFSASAGGGYAGFKASGTFSKKHQESKEKFSKYKSSLLQTKLVYRSFNLYQDSVGVLEGGFMDQIEQISNALSQNLTYQAKYLSEMIVKDFGTHYISSADTGAIIEQETFIDSNYAFTDATTLDSIRASAAASFGSYFHASTEGIHEVTTQNKQTLSKITKHSKIITNGGPDVNAVLSMSDNGTLQVNNLVSFNHDGDWLYQLVTPRNFPNINADNIFSVQTLLKNAIELYYKKNTIRGCMDMNAPNYNFQANVDDGTCKSNNDTYPFGGVFQTCVPLENSPKWRCDNFTQKNLFVGAQSCDEKYFEAVKLLDEVYHFEDRIVKESRKKCKHILFFKKCHNVDYDVIYKDSVSVKAFWCRKKVNVTMPSEKGAMFGGLFESGKPNEFTGEIGCPGTFQPYFLGRSITVCLSYQYERDHVYSIPIEKFFSCQSSSSEKTCSSNFTQHLAAVENSCDLFYCVRKQTYKHQKHPILKRPPYMLEKLAVSNYSTNTVRAMYKGTELFSIPFSMIFDEHFISQKSINGSSEDEIDINGYIDNIHEKVLIVTKNLTATVDETLENIRKINEGK